MIVSKALTWARTRSIALILIVLLACGAKDTGKPTYDEYLDNGVVRVGVETDEYGGAITYLSLSGDTRNLINNHDRGRQVQQSYYSGKNLDRTGEGQSPNWSPWSWNPIQVGDTYGNSAEVAEITNNGERIYVKTLPLLWDMRDERAECFFETWITLDKNTVHVRNRITTHRTDTKWGAGPRAQELPAVYTIADLHRVVSYEGDVPFTNAPVDEIENNGPPWAHWGKDKPIEKWAALLDENDWGVGVYTPEAEFFTGGFHGTPGGGEFDASTGYVSPLKKVSLPMKGEFEYEYDLIVGSLDEIRAFAYEAEGYSKK